jgi:hypothetical protein
MRAAANLMVRSTALVLMTTCCILNTPANSAAIVVGKPDCTKCAIDAFPPDLNGQWSEFCSVFKNADHILQFKNIGKNFAVVDGHHYCNLTDIVDYNKVERRYVVQSKRDCSKGAPKLLISEYRLGEDNSLEIKSKNGKIRFLDCARGVQ